MPKQRAAYRIRKQRRPAVTQPEIDGESLDRVALQCFGRPRRILISEAAYYRAQTTDGATQDPIANWLVAEAEIDRMLRLRLDRRSIEHPEGAP